MEPPTKDIPTGKRETTSGREEIEEEAGAEAKEVAVPEV